MEEIEISEYSEPQKTGYIGAIKKGFKGYVVWNARSTRSECWWWTLFAFIVAIVTSILDSIILAGKWLLYPDLHDLCPSAVLTRLVRLHSAPA